MLSYAVLGSGSSANSYIFSDGRFSFVVDNGFSASELIRRAAAAGFEPGTIAAIFLTHTHSDHLAGVEVLSRRLRCPVILERRLTGVFRRDPWERIDIDPLHVQRFDGLAIEAFPTCHDAEHSVSYHFRFAGRVFTILTDTGTVTPDMADRVAESDVVFLEANYDPVMLEEGPYPLWLKRRIASEVGHLSNSQALLLLNDLPSSSRPRGVYFCHLSATNNSPDLLARSAAESLRWRGEYVICPKGQMRPGTL